MDMPSKSRINKAGFALRDAKSISSVPTEDMDLINKWRFLYETPIDIIKPHLINIAKNIDINFILATRLKKVKSIQNKLYFNKDMMLSRLQDIGGCRLIFTELRQVYQFVEDLKRIDMPFEIITDTDYIKKPRNSGYRSYHVVLALKTNDEQYADLKIELQIRTRLQHAWATAVEMASLITETSLKSGEGDENWLHFLKLLSAYFAFQENTTQIFDFDKERIVEEIKKENEEHNFITKLTALTNFVQVEIEHKSNYSLLYINSESKECSAIGFDNYTRAYETYTQWEKKENGVDNVVLVYTNMIDDLKIAYPNYFADISTVIKILTQIIN